MSFMNPEFWKQVRCFMTMEYYFIIRSARPRKMIVAILAIPLFWYSFHLNGVPDYEPLLYLIAFSYLSIGPYSYAQYFFSWQASFLISIASLPVYWMAYFTARIVPVTLLIIYSAIPPLHFFWNTGLVPKIIAISFYLIGALPFCLLVQNARGVVSFDENAKGFFSNFIGKTKHQLFLDWILLGTPLLFYGLELGLKDLPILKWYLYAGGVGTLVALPFIIRHRCKDKIWLERIVTSNEKRN
jgi:hypothetical protein